MSGHSSVIMRIAQLALILAQASGLLAHAQEPDKPKDPDPALLEKRRLQQEASALLKQGQYAAAIAPAEKVLALDRKLHGDKHAATAGSLQLLGLTYWGAHRLKEADKCLRELAETWRTLRGESDDAYIRNLIHLGNLQKEMGQGQRSYDFYRQALVLKNRTGVRDTLLAEAAEAFGRYFRDRGEVDRGAALLRMAVAIRADVQGKQHADYGRSLMELGCLYTYGSQFKIARPILEEAAATLKTASGEVSRDYASALQNLGVLYHYLGELELSQETYRRALAVFVKLHAQQQQYLTSVSLGQVAASLGNYQEAEESLTRALRIYESAPGLNDHDYNLAKRSLADVYAATGRTGLALTLYAEALDAQQKELQTVFASTTEKGMFDYLARIAGTPNTLLLLASLQQATDASAGATALTWVLRRKGIILETLCRFREAENTITNDPNVRRQSQDLQRLRSQLAELESASRKSDDPAEESKRQRLADLVDMHERQYHQTLSAYRKKQTQPFHSVDVEQVRRKLPENSALIELVRAETRNLKATGKQPVWGPERYWALVLSQESAVPVRIVDLGLAAPIDSAVQEFRTKIQHAPGELRAADEKTVEDEFRPAAAELYRLVFGPLRALLGKANTVYIAPDGELNRFRSRRWLMAMTST